MTAAAVAQIEEISEATTPYNWRNQAKAEGKPVPGHSKNSEQWSAGEVSKDLAAQTVGSCHKQWRISCSPALSIALPKSDRACQSYRKAAVNITEPPYTDTYVRWCGWRLIVR